MADLEAFLKKTQLLHPNEVEDKTCPVCLEDYLQGPSREPPRKLQCGHLIGTECLSVWASSQNRITSTKCPWCRQPIIKPVQRKRAPRGVDREQRAARAVDRGQRAPRAVDREHVEQCPRWLVLASYAFRVVYFGKSLAWLPLGFLYVYTTISIKRRLRAYPWLGMLLLVLGLCVRTFLDEDLGKVLMKHGKAPFEPAIGRVFKDHMWAVLGLLMAIFWARIVIRGLTGETHYYRSSDGALLRMFAISQLGLDFDVSL